MRTYLTRGVGTEIVRIVPFLPIKIAGSAECQAIYSDDETSSFPLQESKVFLLPKCKGKNFFESN